MSSDIMALCARVERMTAIAQEFADQWSPTERLSALHELHSANMLLTWLIGASTPPCPLGAVGVPH